MTAAINFYVNNMSDEHTIEMVGGSGIAFFGDAGFGRSVQVGSWQGTTYVSDDSGVEQGAQLNNVKYLSANSGIVNGTTTLNVLNIPNYQSTVKIRFSNDSEVSTANSILTIYDRTSTSNAPSGVTCNVYECLNPQTSQAVEGSGLTTWTECAGSTTLHLADSPGISGNFAGSGLGSTHLDTVHDYFCCLSCSPDSVGSKDKFAMAISLEYT
jgi:hypothetical protein